MRRLETVSPELARDVLALIPVEQRLLAWTTATSAVRMVLRETASLPLLPSVMPSDARERAPLRGEWETLAAATEDLAGLWRLRRALA